MRALVLTLTPVLALALLSPAPVVADTEIRRIEEQFDVSAEHDILLEVPIGELSIEPGVRGRVEIEIVVSCGSRRCRERAEDVYLDDALRQRSLTLEVRGLENKLTARPSLAVTLRMPPGNALEIDLGVGEIKAKGLRGSLDIDLGVGEARIAASEEDVRSIRLEVGVGDLVLRPERDDQEDSGFLFLGNELYWDDGPGRADLSVDVGVGEIRVDLE